MTSDVAELLHGEFPDSIAHLRMHLLEYGSRVRLTRPGDRPCRSTLRLPPDGRSDAVALHRPQQALGSGPYLALTHSQEQVPAPGSIEPEYDLLESRRQQGAKLPNRLPHRHQLRHRDVAPDEIEHLIGTVVAMETDPPTGAHVQRQLGAVRNCPEELLYNKNLSRTDLFLCSMRTDVSEKSQNLRHLSENRRHLPSIC